MKTKTSEMLPQNLDSIANGGLYLQFRKCGKKSCRCLKGQMHSGYYFLTRRNGKQIKRYVRKAEVEQFRLLVEQASRERHKRRRILKSNLELLKEFRQTLREKDLIIKNIKGAYNR